MDDHKSFYYNATIQNPGTPSTTLVNVPATFGESRAVPILRDTTNWKVGLARMSTYGATTMLPLWEAPVAAGGTVLPYTFTLAGSWVGTVGVWRSNVALTLEAAVSVQAAIVIVLNLNDYFFVTLRTLVGDAQVVYKVVVSAGKYTPSGLAAAINASIQTLDHPIFKQGFGVTGGVNGQMVLTMPSVYVSPTNGTQFVSINVTGTVSSGLITQIGFRVGAQIQNTTSIPLPFTAPDLMTLGSVAGLASMTLPATSGMVPAALATAVQGLLRGAQYALQGLADAVPVYAGGVTPAATVTVSAGNIMTVTIPTASTATNGYNLTGVASLNLTPGISQWSVLGFLTGNASGTVVATTALVVDAQALVKTFTATRAVTWTPQHVGDPEKYRHATSYQHVCNIVNRTLVGVQADISSQMATWSGVAVVTPAPVMSYDGDVFTLTVSKAFVPALSTAVVGATVAGNVGVESFALYQNVACAALLPFPCAINYDLDGPSSRGLDATVLLDVARFNTNYDPLTGVIASASVPQEWNATSGWCPYVGMTITSSGIPAQAEMMGTTFVTGGTLGATLGGNSRTILFDMDLQGTSAHDYITGISFSPTIMRYAALQGGALPSIDFTCWLRRRDGGYDAWNVPSYGCIDLKLRFEYDDGGSMVEDGP